MLSVFVIVWDVECASTDREGVAVRKLVKVGLSDSSLVEESSEVVDVAD